MRYATPPPTTRESGRRLLALTIKNLSSPPQTVAGITRRLPGQIDEQIAALRLASSLEKIVLKTRRRLRRLPN